MPISRAIREQDVTAPIDDTVARQSGGGVAGTIDPGEIARISGEATKEAAKSIGPDYGGMLIGAVLAPVLGPLVAAELGVSTAAGTALAKVGIDVANGADLKTAVKNAAMSTLIQTGSAEVANEIVRNGTNPVVANSLTSAGGSAVQSAVSGGKSGDITRSFVGGLAGGAVGEATGLRPVGTAIQTGLATGNVTAGLISGIGSGISEAARTTPDTTGKVAAASEYDVLTDPFATKTAAVAPSTGAAAGTTTLYADSILDKILAETESIAERESALGRALTETEKRALIAQEKTALNAALAQTEARAALPAGSLLDKIVAASESGISGSKILNTLGSIGRLAGVIAVPITIATELFYTSPEDIARLEAAAGTKPSTDTDPTLPGGERVVITGKRLPAETAAPAPAPASNIEPYIVISVNPATKKGNVINQAGKVLTVDLPSGTQPNSQVNIDSKTNTVVGTTGATTIGSTTSPAPSPAPTPGTGGTRRVIGQPVTREEGTAPAPSPAPAPAPASSTTTSRAPSPAPSTAAAPATSTSTATGTAPAPAPATSTATAPTTTTTTKPPVPPVKPPPAPTPPAPTPKPPAPAPTPPAPTPAPTPPAPTPPAPTPAPVAPAPSPATSTDVTAPAPAPGEPPTIRPYIYSTATSPASVGAITPTLFRSPLEQALTAYTPPGELEYGTLGERKPVWNVSSLRLKDALGL